MNRITRVFVVSALAAATLSACSNNDGHDMTTMSSALPGGENLAFGNGRIHRAQRRRRQVRD